MLIENILDSVELPAVHRREGKDCYFDTFRKKLIEITPEETVRQKVARYFEEVLGVPRDMISLEVPMSYYVKGAAGRADIIVHVYDEQEQCMYPLTIIECKKKDVFLTDNVADQAARYCDTVGGKYIVITNGIEIRMAVYDESIEVYTFLDGLLSYKDMVSEDYVIPNFEQEKTVRFSIDELQDQNKLKEYNEQGSWIFGADTEPALRSFAVNFYQALLDCEHKLPEGKFKTFQMLEDLGQRYLDYSNAGGGHYNGIYRSFLVNDRFNETQIVSVSIFGTDANFRGENRGSYTSLVVSIDRFKTSHNSLQYNVDRYVKYHQDGVVEFFHNGQIGGYKSSDVINKVRAFGAFLISSERGIELGCLDNKKLLYLDDVVVVKFIYSLIEYALLREEVRRDKKCK